MNQENVSFTAVYNKCTVTMEFKKEWSNGIGYFNHAVSGEHAPKLPPKMFAKSMSPGGRRMIMVGTKFGNIVVFDRFRDQAPTQKDEGKAVFVYNAPAVLLDSGNWPFGSVLFEGEVREILSESFNPQPEQAG